MAHIGFLSLYATGHLNPSLALGRFLAEEGHTVTFFNVPDTEISITAQRVNFVPFGQDVYPIGALRSTFEKISRLHGAAGFAFFLERMILLAQTAFRDLPSLLRERAVDLLVIDQLFPGGATVAQHLGIPFISLAAAVPVNPDPAVPPPTLPWHFADSAEARARNQAGWTGVHQAFTPWREADNAQRAIWSLPPFADLLRDSMSPLLQLSQLPHQLDFPRDTPPATLHCVGPFTHPAAQAELADRLDFPFHQLTGKPVVYASLGTLQNGLDWVFRAIVEAASAPDLEIQLVLSLGGSPCDPASLGPLSPTTLVLPYVPQSAVLARATACITHAGLNTALDAVSHGVPTLAIPITNDQPGVAARLLHAGAGLTLHLSTGDPASRLSPESIADGLRALLQNATYRTNAQRLQQSIAALTPLEAAAKLIRPHLPV